MLVSDFEAIKLVIGAFSGLERRAVEHVEVILLQIVEDDPHMVVREERLEQLLGLNVDLDVVSLSKDRLD